MLLFIVSMNGEAVNSNPGILWQYANWELLVVFSMVLLYNH